jgi:SET domain-containing protein
VRDEPPADVWVDERVEVGASGIEGDGLFARADLAANTPVLRLGGRLVTTEELDALITAADADPDAPYVDTFTVYEDAHVVLPPGTRAHYANHSCDPNLWYSDAYTIVTRRDITADEELTIDYATISGAPGFTMPCTCGAPECRGAVTSDDWRIIDLQARYRGHWSPALEARITTA